MKYILKLEKVQKSYKDGKNELQVLKNVSLEIKEGEFICIKGNSGSGKSTLLNLIGGLDFHTRGNIFIGNQNIQNIKKKSIEKFRSRNIGFIFQRHYLLLDMTVLENVMLPLILLKIKYSIAKQKAESILNNVGLLEKAYSRPNKISGGESQRVAIARAIVHKPSILLADEPTGNLDKENTYAFFSILEKLQKENRQTILMVTHEENIFNIKRKNYILKNGILEKQ